MAGIMDILNSGMGQQIISGIAGESGQSEAKTAKVLGMGLPLLTKAMTNNATASPEGAQGLLGALQNSKHDGSILDNLGSFFQGGVDKEAADDGNKILGHILGGKQAGITQAISKKSGVDAGSVGKILSVAAPILMGFLGRESRQGKVSDASGLGSLLGGMLQGSSSKEQGLIDALLGGKSGENLLGTLLGGGSKKGGGGLLGGLFGK